MERILLGHSSAHHPFISTPRKMFPFKNTRALFLFISAIDGNADTVRLIEGFVF